MLIAGWGQGKDTKQEVEFILQRKEFPYGENITSVMTSSQKEQVYTELSLFWYYFPCVSEGVGHGMISTLLCRTSLNFLLCCLHILSVGCSGDSHIFVVYLI